MNTAIILAGGTGTRLGGNIPKQFIIVGNKPVMMYCLEKFENNAMIDEIVIVAANEWRHFILKYLSSITKFKTFASAGENRQHSILNGMNAVSANTTNIIIHDAARPNVSNRIINECVNGLKDYDGVMPVLPVKDTIYYSEAGEQINSLLNRDQLFAGQSPESFRFDKYFGIHQNVSVENLSLIRGSSEIAFRNGLKIKMIKGDEHNYKITTIADLEKFKSEIE